MTYKDTVVNPLMSIAIAVFSLMSILLIQDIAMLEVCWIYREY